MDDALRERIRKLAEESGLDPAELERTMLTSDIPEDMVQAMAAALDDISLFDQALSKLDKKES